jgi:hypothetical protein
LRNSLTLQLFLIKNFAGNVNDEIYLNTHETALRVNHLPVATSSDTTPPRLEEVFPIDGQRIGPEPRIRLKLSDGSVAQSQVNPATVQLSLDGTPLTNVTITHRIRPYDSSAHRPYDTLLVEDAIATAIPEGHHVLLVTATAFAGDTVSKTISFEVSRSCGDDPPDWDGHGDHDH